MSWLESHKLLLKDLAVWWRSDRKNQYEHWAFNERNIYLPQNCRQLSFQRKILYLYAVAVEQIPSLQDLLRNLQVLETRHLSSWQII